MALLLSALLFTTTLAEVDVSRWYGRSIYFVVTDRFAKTDADADADDSCNGGVWCGGTLRGLHRKLDYIQGMGFDAIWITPVVEQVEWVDSYNGTGYHGYWAKDFMQIDPHLGTPEDLEALQKSCASRDMLLMVDVVANHVGPIDSLDRVSKLAAPLNSSSLSQFHQLDRRAGESASEYIHHPVKFSDAGNCWPNYDISDGCNYTKLLDGWFYDLADLNQDDPATRRYLLDWIAFMQQRYKIDGFRLDTATYLPKDFLAEFQQAAGVYMVGEVPTYNFTWHKSFTPSLTGLLNFPITEHIKTAFSGNGSLANFADLLTAQHEAGYPDLSLLGNFVDNHDNERFLNAVGSASQLKNALAWTLLYHGIPIVYYGTEQIEVSNVSDDRTSMWPYFEQTELYDFLKEVNSLRKAAGFASNGRHARTLAQTVSADAHNLVFARGDLLVAVRNSDQQETLCVPTDELQDALANACDSSHKVSLAFGEGRADCNGSSLCVTLTQGPAAFTVDTSAAWVV